MEEAVEPARLPPPESPAEVPAAQPPPPAPYLAPNPLRRLVVPGLAVAVLGGLIIAVVIPLCQRIYRFQANPR